MTTEYQTVFEVSYSDNRCLQTSLLFLCVGIALVIGFIIPWVAKRVSRQKRIAFLYVFGPFFIVVGAILVYSDLSSGRKFISALANNQCDVVDGTVQVLHETRWGGHDPEGGDHVRVGNREFTYSDWDVTLSYNKTISHGGALRNGVVARLHYIGNDILEVETKK
jgi:hypothetical protein